MPSKRISLVIHAGAGSYLKNLERAQRIQKKLKQICEEGSRFLKNHSAVETVSEVVRRLEDWPDTNAGTGAMLQSDGKARLSASLMDGCLARFSGVINIEEIKNPILVATLLQKEPDRVLTAQGAARFAKEKGFKRFDPRTEKSIRHWGMLRKTKKMGSYGTVGACALDRFGRLASATSTGGKGMERVGRVSDSALPSGNYANHFAAVSATGLGEDIIEESLASTLVIRATDSNNLERSFQTTFAQMKARKRRLAAIGVDRKGNVFWNKTTDILYYAFYTSTHSGYFTI